MINVNDPVKVLVPENGQIVQANPQKPEYGSIGFQQTQFVNKDGFLSHRRRVAFVNGRMADLEAFAQKANLQPEKSLPGRIVVEERTTPFYEGQEPKINPSTGQAILCDGALIYSKSTWVTDPNTTDVYVSGEITTGDVIRNPATAESAGIGSSKN